MSDYDFEPRQAPSVFLKTASQGDAVKFRLASSPYREPKVWKEGVRKPLDAEETTKLTPQQWVGLYRDPDYNIAEIFHWKVIDRNSGQAKIYSGSPMVYKAIKKHAEMEDWGDPTTYDFRVERTEKPGAYYEITALPNKVDLTDAEKKSIDDLNLEEKLPAARKVSDEQIDHIDEMDQSAEAEAQIKPEPKKDVVIEDITDGSTPINLDDIPF